MDNRRNSSTLTVMSFNILVHELLLRAPHIFCFKSYKNFHDHKINNNYKFSTQLYLNRDLHDVINLYGGRRNYFIPFSSI